ncbi:MAG: serine/threonine protein kinase [Victivallales bacterium]|nr:serine/threonine protein kinase [Victivallales bacterium]
MIIRSDKEFSDDRLEGSDPHPEEEALTGTMVMGAKDMEFARHAANYKELLVDEIPRMRQRSAFAAFCAELLEMFGSHKYDSEYNIDDISENLEPSEEEQNTDASSFHEEGAVCDLEDNYPLGKEFAHGGQGTISAAKDLQFGRRVAVKSLREPENQTNRHQFFTEARITAHLEHPGVVPIHTLYVDHNNAPHLAMKLVEGKSFRERLQEVKKKYASLPWYKICAVERWQRKLRIERFLRVCEALEYAHNRNILHRDLKPENIMVGRFGEVYVMDWGMAMVMPQGQDWVVSPICGTPRYIAPEILMHKPYGKTADVYQLGLILYEIVFLRRAFPWKSKDVVLERVKAGEMAPMQHYYGCRVPKLLVKIIARATAFSVRDRYQTVGELARDLRGYLKNEATSVERNPRLSSFMRVMSRNSHLLLGTIILVTTILFAVILFNVRSKVNEKLHVQREEEALRRLYSSNLHTSVMIAQEIKDVAEDVLSLARETRVRLATLQPPNPDFNYYRGTAGMIDFPPPGYGYVPTFDNKVSFRAFFWHLPANVQVENLDSVLSTLYPMMPTFKRILTDHFLVDKTGHAKNPISDLGVERTPVLNSRVAFENKLMLAYPYEGNMPGDYDVTTSVWYQCGMNEAKDRPVWTHLFQSVRVRNRIIIACAMPIRLESAPAGFNSGVAVAVLDPRDFIAKFAVRLTHAPYIKGHYLVHASGKVYSTDVEGLEPVCHGEIELFDFPHQEKFREMWELKTGRLFLDNQKRDTLYIFNLVEDMNCIYIEEIDFARAMEMAWTAQPDSEDDNAAESSASVP